MTGKPEGDGAIDEMLRKVLRTEAAHATASDECLDAETVAAWSDGTLPPSSAAHVESHLSQCARCQALLAALVRSAPPAEAAAPVWRRWHLRWVVPIAAAASALALWIAVPSNREPAAERRAAVEESKQAVPTAPAARDVPADARDQLQPNRERRADAGNRIARLQKAVPPPADAPPAAPPPSPAPASAAAADAAAANSARQEAVAAPRAAPAAAPAERAELSAASQTVPIVESAAPDSSGRWRVVNRSRIERSTDSGATWQPVPFTAAPNPAAVRAVSALSAIVTAADGRQFRTDDAGMTWIPVVR